MPHAIRLKHPYARNCIAYYSSEYLTPMLCRNLRSSSVSIVGFLAFGRFADSEVKHSRQQSERGFTVQTLLRHRGHRQWITKSCVEETPTDNICFGLPPHSHDIGNVRYSIFRYSVFRHQLRNRRSSQRWRRGWFSFEFFQKVVIRTRSALVRDKWIPMDMGKINW